MCLVIYFIYYSSFLLLFAIRFTLLLTWLLQNKIFLTWSLQVSTSTRLDHYTSRHLPDSTTTSQNIYQTRQLQIKISTRLTILIFTYCWHISKISSSDLVFCDEPAHPSSNKSKLQMTKKLRLKAFKTLSNYIHLNIVQQAGCLLGFKSIWIDFSKFNSTLVHVPFGEQEIAFSISLRLFLRVWCFWSFWAKSFGALEADSLLCGGRISVMVIE